MNRLLSSLIHILVEHFTLFLLILILKVKLRLLHFSQKKEMAFLTSSSLYELCTNEAKSDLKTGSVSESPPPAATSRAKSDVNVPLSSPPPSSVSVKHTSSAR